VHPHDDRRRRLKPKKLGGATYVNRREVLAIVDLVSADAS
jgi:hypothetical protein